MTDRELYKEQMRRMEPRADFARETVALLRRERDDLSQREKYGMFGNKRIRTAAAALVAVIMLAGTAFAAARLLSPSEVAERVGEAAIAEAFRSEDAEVIGESQTAGEYVVTLLGTVSGEQLSAVNDGGRWIAVSIARADGAPLDDLDGCPLTLLPVMDGYAPWRVSGYLFDMGGMYFVEDGVMYYLFGCDELECFADRGVKLAVFEGIAPERDVFAFDEETGEVSFCESYGGAQAMFDLRLEGCADKEAAARQRRERLEDAGFKLDADGNIIEDEDEARDAEPCGGEECETTFAADADAVGTDATTVYVSGGTYTIERQ